MEAVSTSNLVSSEAEKTTTTCNFQNININSFIMPHDLMRGQIGSYEYRQIQSYSSYDAKLSKSAIRNTYTQNSKMKTDQQ